jgi:hypothetical protein
MNPAPQLIGLLLALGLATGAPAASPGPPSPCRHPLASVASPDELPATVIASLKPWLAMHGEPWNATDSVSRGDLRARYLWAARSSGDWIVAYGVGGITCCSVRLALFTPAASGFKQVIPPRGGPDKFGDATCKGVDAVLDAYGTRTWR